MLKCTQMSSFPHHRSAVSQSVTDLPHTEALPILHEPFVDYAWPGSATGLRGALKPRAEHHLTAFEKIGLVQNGISKRALEGMKGRFGWDYNQLSDVLSVARAKLINKKGDERFDKGVSEKIVSIADVYAFGYEVFDDEATFNRWIFRPNIALGGEAPFHFLDTQFGREEVKNIIGRIAHGVYS
jgi:putative toxin-antitoxin system antitoxin component (TIGR02293 family)